MKLFMNSFYFSSTFKWILFCLIHSNSAISITPYEALIFNQSDLEGERDDKNEIN